MDLQLTRQNEDDFGQALLLDKKLSKMGLPHHRIDEPLGLIGLDIQDVVATDFRTGAPKQQE